MAEPPPAEPEPEPFRSQSPLEPGRRRQAYRRASLGDIGDLSALSLGLDGRARDGLEASAERRARAGCGQPGESGRGAPPATRAHPARAPTEPTFSFSSFCKTVIVVFLMEFHCRWDK